MVISSDVYSYIQHWCVMSNKHHDIYILLTWVTKELTYISGIEIQGSLGWHYWNIRDTASAVHHTTTKLI